MNRRPGYSKAVRERAVRLVLTGEHDHSSRWAAIQSVASKIGCTPETLRSWVKKMEVDSGVRLVSRPINLYGRKNWSGRYVSSNALMKYCAMPLLFLPKRISTAN